MPFEKLDIDINGSKTLIKNFFRLPYINEYKEKRVIFYKIGNQGENFLSARRKGIPICTKSFDIITLFISLMVVENFRKSLLEDIKLTKIWKNLWKLNEYDKLMNEINKTKENNFKIIFRIVRKYHIRFDALEYLFTSIWER